MGHSAWLLFSVLVLTPLSLILNGVVAGLVAKWLRFSAPRRWYLTQLVVATGVSVVWSMVAFYRWQDLWDLPFSPGWADPFQNFMGPLQFWIAVYAWPVFVIPVTIYYWFHVRQFTVRELMASVALIAALIVVGKSVVDVGSERNNQRAKHRRASPVEGSNSRKKPQLENDSRPLPSTLISRVVDERDGRVTRDQSWTTDS